MLPNGAPLLVFGKESDKERFAILRLKDLTKLVDIRKIRNKGNRN